MAMEIQIDFRASFHMFFPETPAKSKEKIWWLGHKNENFWKA